MVLRLVSSQRLLGLPRTALGSGWEQTGPSAALRRSDITPKPRGAAAQHTDCCAQRRNALWAEAGGGRPRYAGPDLAWERHDEAAAARLAISFSAGSNRSSEKAQSAQSAHRYATLWQRTAPIFRLGLGCRGGLMTAAGQRDVGGRPRVQH